MKRIRIASVIVTSFVICPNCGKEAEEEMDMKSDLYTIDCGHCGYMETNIKL